MTARHVAIILDGNRRWARKRGMKPWQGHDVGLEKLRKITKAAYDFGIIELTLYVFSAQNINRSSLEVNKLFSLLGRSCSEMLEDETIKEKEVRVRFIGNRDIFPKELQSLMHQVEQKTKNYDKCFLNFAAGYGGREEITEAVKKITREVKQGLIDPSSLNQQTITDHLWLQTDPDIVIRTGGEIRTSNFFPWQTIYSEWFFVKKLWPDFTPADLKKVLNGFNKRKRNFGK
ncbi:MAG: polyprenyl diphosphate synthase [Nanoarchaeota archaeon]